MTENHQTILPADDLVLVLPWYVTGRLAKAETLHVEAMLSYLPLRNDLAAILLEKAAISSLNDDLGEPSPRSLSNLLAAISAESGPAGGPFLSSLAD